MESYDYAVIGGGIAGYVSAIRAGQLGLRTVLVEKESRLGGTCLNVGCIPSKALLESSEHYARALHSFPEHGIRLGEVKLNLSTMMKRKEGVVKTLTDGIRLLMKKNKVTVLEGLGRLTAADRIAVTTAGGEQEITAGAICLATGSVPVELPFMPFDHTRVVNSTDALSFVRVPKHLVVIGAGAVGLELGSVWSRLGAKVTVIEMLPQIAPFADKQLATTLMRLLKDQGMEFLLNTKVTSAKVTKQQVALTWENGKGESGTVKGDKVLVAVGRRPFHEGVGLEAVGITPEASGHIAVDDQFRTSVPSIYAVGDLIHGPALAHKGEEEGVAVAEIIAGRPGHVNYDIIPNVIYTAPELATVGLHEKEAKERGIEVKVGKFYFRANGRALGMGESDGLVKVVADAKSDRVLGVHILGPRASDMIAEAVVAMEFQASAEDIARTIHAHPTLPEALKEAALAVDKRAIHS